MFPEAASIVRMYHHSAAQEYVQAILSYLETRRIEMGKLEIATLIAECAARLLLHDTGFAGTRLEGYLNGSLELNGYGFLVDDLIYDKEASLSFIHKFPDLFSIAYRYEANEDVLGLLYLSTENLGDRKAVGSYYTPTKVVKMLCGKLFARNETLGKRLLDPCCGTGNFLLQLPDDIGFDRIYGSDTDELSVKIARIN